MPSLASRILLSSALLGAGLVGCGPYQGDLEGTWDGAAFEPTIGFWGGPFLVFSESDIECMDLFWVAKNYNDDEAPWDSDVRLVQIAFQEADVVEGGPYEVSGVSPVQGAMLTIDQGDLFLDDARAGTLTIDKIDGKDRVHGEMDLSFAGGSLAGSFRVEQCVNLDSAY
ncbi:MAG: hypothetical protein H6742_11250 [Alphaproteobacteria bacterium]|nr:hypothetical protein [Alphaproteobacteria bacterium]